MRGGWLLGICAVALGVASGCAGSAAGGNRSANIDGPAYAADLADAARIRDRLTALRAAAGRSPAATFISAEPNLRGARRHILDGDDPKVVLEDHLQLAAENSERDIGYWYIEASSVETVPLPRRLLSVRYLNIAIMVMHPARSGDRSRVLVLFAMADFNKD